MKYKCVQVVIIFVFCSAVLCGWERERRCVVMLHVLALINDSWFQTSTSGYLHGLKRLFTFQSSLIPDSLSLPLTAGVTVFGHFIEHRKMVHCYICNCTTFYIDLVPVHCSSISVDSVVSSISLVHGRVNAGKNESKGNSFPSKSNDCTKTAGTETCTRISIYIYTKPLFRLISNHRHGLYKIWNT